MNNPYSASSTADTDSRLKPPVFRSALLLNATLIAIPIAIGSTAYLWAYMSAMWETAMTTSDPVAFQHFYSVDINPWFAIAYFLVPNGMLLGSHYDWKSKSRPDETGHCK